MFDITDTFGAIGMFAALLIQGGPPWAGHDGGGFWGPWILFPLLFWGGIVFLIAWTVTRIFPKGRGDDRSEGPRDSAEEILRERFARGEINAEEYERSLEILRMGTARGPPNKIPPGSAGNGRAKTTSSIGKPRSCT